ncbi:MAG TPA: hypothetical protein VMQ48_00620 [Candidatus Saccharimonadales bacterium]|nr:hypothetical protein [Candidatus Saccharimonadales bacterium]
MPSQDYSGAANVNTPRLDRLREARSNYAGDTGKAAEKFGPTPRHLALSEKGKLGAEKEMQRKLSSLQRNAPKTAAGLAKGKKMAVAKFAGRIFMQIDWTVDWLFILLGSFALLKDIFDIVFAAAGTAGSGIWSVLVGWIPLAGPALAGAGDITMAAIGITISFTGDLMFLILTVTVLVLVGSSLKNRGMAKYFIGIAMEFIAEALPGISWLPWTSVYVFILYFCVLYDRAYGRQAQQVENPEQTENENTEPAAQIDPQASANFSKA